MPKIEKRGAPQAFKQMRIDRGLRANYVAGKLGISKTRLCELENNYKRVRVSADELRGLAAIYGTSIDELLQEGGTANAGA